MTKEDLLEKIWSEKRGREVITSVYPLGLLITLDQEKRTLHEITSGILQLLSDYPERGLEWASYWGRTIIQVHPTKEFGFQFSMRKDAFEKLGVMVSSDVLYSPAEFLDTESNLGRYLVLLNKSSVLYEGVVLAVERMVDELVWCTYQDLLRKQEPTPKTYLLAVTRVIQGGVKFNFASEAEILNLKKHMPDIPVRIYGQMYKDVKIPLVVGCLVDTQNTEHEVRALKTIPTATLAKVVGSSTIKPFSKTDPVCISLTSAKPLHAGHVFHIVFADLVRRSLKSELTLVLESNDVGERIVRLVAQLAQDLGLKPDDVMRRMLANTISPGSIYAAYVSRANAGQNQVQQAHALLKNNQDPLLSSIETEVALALQTLGLEIKIFRDSESCRVFRELFSSKSGFLDRSGFSAVKYQGENTHAMIVTQKKGMPTASAVRASFMARIPDFIPGAKQALFVDSELSVQAGVKLLSITGHPFRVGSIEGAGVSMGFKPGSATLANLPSLKDVVDFLKYASPRSGPEDIFGMLSYFVLTRSLTAHGHKKHPLAIGSPVGQGYYDYASKEAFFSDLQTAFGQYHEFLEKLRATACFLDSYEEGVDSKEENKELKILLLKLQQEVPSTDITRVVPFSRPVNLEKRTRLFREKLHRHSLEKDTSLLDRIFISGLSQGYTNSISMSTFLLAHGCVTHLLEANNSYDLKCVFLTDLIRRGYTGDELLLRATEYLSGHWVLLYKEIVYFTRLQQIIQAVSNISRIEETQELRMFLSFCSQVLGFNFQGLN